MQTSANAVICESIHLEASGKFILVGVFNGIIRTDSSELDDEYCLFLNFHNLPLGNNVVELKFSTPNGKSSTNAVPVNVRPDEANHTVQITSIPFRTEESGIFSMSWRLAGSKKWSKLVQVSVELCAEFDEV